uniref:Uncharacterized protein n=1 Tax=Cannabis sativa TaxID=3483 RepID=A0A803R8Y0_CANSA
MGINSLQRFMRMKLRLKLLYGRIQLYVWSWELILHFKFSKDLLNEFRAILELRALFECIMGLRW